MSIYIMFIHMSIVCIHNVLDMYKLYDIYCCIHMSIFGTHHVYTYVYCLHTHVYLLSICHTLCVRYVAYVMF